METINFPCEHCQKLMAVTLDSLGRAVRCPHCHQVVTAPLSSVPSPSSGPTHSVTVDAPSFAEPPRHEDIFTPPEQISDDLFGAPPQVHIPDLPSLEPTLPLSSPPPPPELPVELSTSPTLPSSGPPAPFSSPEPFTEVEPHLTFVPPGSPGTETTEVIAPGPLPEPPSPGPAPWTEPSPAPSAEAQSLPALETVRPSAGARRQRADWFNALILYPLILYALVVSGFLAWYMYNSYQLKQALDNASFFDQLPDQGDKPGVRKGEKKVSNIEYTEKIATRPLPRQLITTLKTPLVIGELEVTPWSVTRQRVGVIVKGFDTPAECTNDSLVLELHFRNRSTDQAFAPLDGFFDRYWRSGAEMGPPPLTVVEAGKDHFFGGPARWHPRGDESSHREWITLRHDEEPDLQPGQTSTGYVCTDGGNPRDDLNPRAALVLLGQQDGKKVRQPYRGPLLWRVHVRRGLVDWKGRQVSATAVIGVRLTDQDIQ